METARVARHRADVGELHQDGARRGPDARRVLRPVVQTLSTGSSCRPD